MPSAADAPSVLPSKVIAEAKCIRFLPMRSNRLTRKVLPVFEKVSSLDSGTVSPQSPARSCTTFSHAPLLYSSCLDGNLAIHKAPSAACTVALGLAPPSDEPGASSSFSHLSLRPLSSFSNEIEAFSRVRRLTQGGVAKAFSLDRKSPPSSSVNRSAPIRDSS